MDAIPRKIKPKGMKLFFLMCWNLLIDLIPNNIGIIAAWKCAKNKIEKNKKKFLNSIHLKFKQKTSYSLP